MIHCAKASYINVSKLVGWYIALAHRGRVILKSHMNFYFILKTFMIKPKISRIKLFSEMCDMGIRRKENQSQL